MSVDRKYIVSYETQPYSNNFPYSEIKKLEKNKNIAEVREFGSMNFYIECYKRNEDDLVKKIKVRPNTIFGRLRKLLETIIII